MKKSIIPKPLKNDINVFLKKPLYFKMENGLKVIIDENNKWPIVNITLEMDIDPILEGRKKTGIHRVFGHMLRSGTKKYTKIELDDIIDYMGISIDTTFYDIYVSTLKKYLYKSISIISEIVMNCTFDNNKELKNIIKQKLIDIHLYEKNASFILKRARNILLFGDNHPYGEYETIDSIKNIRMNDLKKLYDKYYSPEIFYLSFSGDINKQEVKEICYKYFSHWKKKKRPKKIVNKKIYLNNNFFKKKDNDVKIIFIDLPFLTQSNICIGGPIILKKNDPDYIPSILANGILGYGAHSRLFLNIREKKGYTYGIYSVLKSDKYIGYFSIITKVRNEVTGPAIKDILNEIKYISTNRVSLEELNIKKNEIIGQFLFGLESPEKVNYLFISELINKLPKGYYNNFIKNVKSVTIDDVNKICKKYFNYNFILIVGKKSDILPSIKNIGYPIHFIDRFCTSV